MKLVLGLVICLFLQGCLPLLVAGAGYAVGQGRRGTAAQMEAKGKFLERYNTYKIEMEKINLEREKSNLKPQPILDFDAWLSQQPLTPEELKLFNKYKAQTPEELKEQK